MAFDNTNQANLTALKTEVLDDPINMGYASVIDQTNNLLKLLNNPDNNVGGETTGVNLTPAHLLDALDPSDLASAQVSVGELDFIASFMGRDLDQDIERWRAKIISVLPNNSATETALNALSRTLSRAEVLFGVGTEISREDWFRARDNG